MLLHLAIITVFSETSHIFFFKKQEKEKREATYRFEVIRARSNDDIFSLLSGAWSRRRNTPISRRTTDLRHKFPELSALLPPLHVYLRRRLLTFLVGKLVIRSS